MIQNTITIFDTKHPADKLAETIKGCGGTLTDPPEAGEGGVVRMAFTTKDNMAFERLRSNLPKTLTNYGVTNAVLTSQTKDSPNTVLYELQKGRLRAVGLATTEGKNKEQIASLAELLHQTIGPGKTPSLTPQKGENSYKQQTENPARKRFHQRNRENHHKHHWSL